MDQGAGRPEAGGANLGWRTSSLRATKSASDPAAKKSDFWSKIHRKIVSPRKMPGFHLLLPEAVCYQGRAGLCL